MRTDSLGPKMGQMFFLIWAILCILFFVLFPGRESYVQWSNLGEWQLLSAKLERWAPLRDAISFFWSLAGMLLFSLACISLGSSIAKALGVSNISRPQTLLQGLALLATEFLLGNGLFSLVFLTLSSLYQLTAAYVILLLVLGALVGAGAMKRNLQEVFSAAASTVGRFQGTWWNICSLSLAAGILCFSLLNSTARISYDATAIYFSDAKLTALDKQIDFFVDDNFIVSAFHTSIQYTALIQVFGDQSARMSSWFFAAVFIILSIALAEKMGIAGPSKIILLALLLTSTSFVDLFGDGKVDIQSSAPAIAAVYWMVIDGQRKTLSRPILLLIGLLGGLAFIARPFNVFLVGLFVGIFYFQRTFLRKGFEPLNYRSFLNSVLFIGAGAMGLGIYHLFGNWMIHGDPLAFLLTLARIDASAGPWDYNPDQILVIRLLYPFIATFYNSPMTLGNISPLFVAFLPAALIPEIRKRVLWTSQLSALTAIAVVTLLLWIFLFFTVYELRYVLFLWAILFIPVAEIIAATLESDNQLLQNTAGALIVTLMAFMLLRTLYIPLDTYSPVDEAGNPQCFCESLTPINETAAPGERVLTLSAHRYYLRTDLFACSTQHEEYGSLREAAQVSPESFWLEVYRQGYRYIAFEEEYTTRHLQMGIIPGPENAPDWLELQPLYAHPEGSHMAYRINIENPPTNTEATCKMNDSGIWEVQYNE